MSDAGPQLEEGYCRIANELFDAIMLAPLSKRELLVMFAVIRKTYGYGKKSDDMTMMQIAKLTALPRQHVGQTVRGLAARSMILIRDGKFGKVIEIQKKHALWLEPIRPDLGLSKIRTRPKSGRVGSQIRTGRIPNQDIEDPKSGHTIDNPNKQLQKTTPKDKVQTPSVTAPVWDSYSRTYQDRYGVPPMRNAKVNGMLANFCRRIPLDEAPHIAAYYLGHNSAYYVQRGHPVECLLADAEKLRTEWATGRQTTITQARQMDRTATNANIWGELIAEAKAAEAAREIENGS